MKVWRSAVTALATLISAFAVASSAQQGSPDEKALVLTRSSRDPRGNVRFTIEGHPVTGLYPGATRQVRITVVNPFAFALWLHGLDGRLIDTARRGCPINRSTLRVSGYNGRLPVVIKPYRRSTLPDSITVTMPREASPKCSHAKLLVALTASGRRAGR
ncbi:MAG: hypothetical protein SYR96_05370 [Actinomycetota bacterium]|nr:hypothetical protein [Actinomycetota bacterium]